MEIFESRYFCINRKLLGLIGLWPYERARRKRAKRILVSLSLIGMILPHLTGMIVNYDKDKRVLLEHIGTAMFITLASVKIVSSIVYEDKLKLLYDAISSNWKAVAVAATAPEDSRELQILVDYSEKGRILTLGWMAYLAGGLASFVVLPLSPVLLDVIRPLNESRDRLYIMNGEFLIDRQANYAIIYVYDMLASAITVLIFAACDTMYAACIEHCLGLFAIVKLQMPMKLVDDKSRGASEDAAYHWMLEIIRLHAKILKFTVSLESTYKQSFFAIVAVSLIYGSLLCVLTLLQEDNVLNFIRYVFLCFGVSIHLFYLSWPGQKLIDNSSNLHRKAYLNEWYASSTPAKNLLNFFMQRCSKPCSLTAGGLYVMNFDNFLSITKKSISFMTLFSSFR